MKTLSSYMLQILESEKITSPLHSDPIKTGFHCFDDSFGGFSKGELILVAARPGNELRLFLTSLAINQAIRSFNKILFFTTVISGIELSKMITRHLTYEPLPGSHSAAKLNTIKEKEKQTLPQSLASASFFIEDYCFNIESLIQHSNACKNSSGLEMIFIDDLSLISKKESGEPIPVSRINEILQSLALDLNIPIVCGAYLKSRDSIKRDKNGLVPLPSGNDFTDSSITNYTGKIIFIHCPAYYKESYKGFPLNKCKLLVTNNKPFSHKELVIDYNLVTGFTNN